MLYYLEFVIFNFVYGEGGLSFTSFFSYLLIYKVILKEENETPFIGRLFQNRSFIYDEMLQNKYSDIFYSDFHYLVIMLPRRCGFGMIDLIHC